MSEYKKSNEGAFAKEYQKGLTKREFFAAMAMQGMLSEFSNSPLPLAERAVHQADALIQELNKESK